MSETKEVSWTRLLGRVAKDPFFLGFALAEYRRLHGLDDAEVARWLKCDEVRLKRLSLCRLPTAEDKLTHDVGQIADFVRCDSDRLVRLIREVGVLMALRQEGEPLDDSFLIAARDRKEGEKGHDGGS